MNLMSQQKQAREEFLFSLKKFKAGENKK